MTTRGARLLALMTVPAVSLAVLAAGSAAQEEEAAIPGVSLGFVYEGERIPPIAIRPFTGGGPASDIASIIATDLDYSDRFYVRDSLPAGVDTEGIQYSLWDQYGVDWLLTGNIDSEDGIAFLEVELHDIVFSSIRSRARFPIPPPGHEGFRLAVHQALIPGRRIAAHDADCVQLVDPLRARQEQPHGTEGLAAEVHVGAGDNDPHAGIGQRVRDLADAVVQELGLVDGDDLRVRAHLLGDLHGVGHGLGVDLAAVVGRDAELAAVAVVEVGLEELNPPPGDQRAPNTPD